MPAQPPAHSAVLDRAADACGIEPDYWDIWGRHHITSPATKREILRAFGIDPSSPEALETALAERVRKMWRKLLPPCLVVGVEEQPWTVRLHVPAEWADDTARIDVRLETGETQAMTAPLGSLQEAGREQVDGLWFVAKLAPLPAALPPGYHQVECAVRSLSDSMRLIVAPAQAYWPEGFERSAGLAVHLYGVRSDRNWGCGDFRDLQCLLDWAATDLQVSFLALNPLHAIANRRPFNTSPYLPLSVFYQNFLYLDVEAIEDFTRSAHAQRLRHRPEVCAEIAALRASEHVEYERVHALKLRFLKRMFLTFLRELRPHTEHATERAREFRSFREREGELLQRFALYCALDEFLHRRDPGVWAWPDWPEPYRDPNSAETRAFAQKHWRSVLFYQYLQWQVDRQLAAAQDFARSRGMTIGLYHDLALATDRFGADLWAHREFYASRSRVGSPPDDFSPKGQDWAFPPPNSERHREDGYRLFTESIRKNCRHGGALRIDHVMRFFRLYWIPDGADATGGAYVRDRYLDLIRIVALESVRQRVVVVGEDLGTVQPYVRETLRRFGVLSYRLFYFEKDEDGAFREHTAYPEQALVSSTTHDLPTLAGFWVGEDIEARRRGGVLPDEASYLAALAARAEEKQRMLDVLSRLRLLPEGFPRSAAQLPELSGELHNAVIGFLALTPSRLMVVNQEDLTKEFAQQNLPGTTWQYPNWGRKMKFTLEELRTLPIARDFTAMFHNWMDRAGRSGGAPER